MDDCMYILCLGLDTLGDAEVQVKLHLIWKDYFRPCSPVCEDECFVCACGVSALLFQGPQKSGLASCEPETENSIIFPQLAILLGNNLMNQKLFSTKLNVVIWSSNGK